MKHKRLFKILSTIENAIAIIFGIIGMILLLKITHTWTMFFIVKSLGLVLIMFAYWELAEE